MKRFKNILQSNKGDTFIFILILVFFILTLSAILIEYFRMESLYQQVEYVLQRGVNSSVEAAMRDEYRRDGYARMDAELAEKSLYAYLHDSMRLDTEMNKHAGEQWVYQLEIENIEASESPPCLMLKGKLKTRSIFSFLSGDIHLPFTISSVNNRIEKGGSE